MSGMLFFPPDYLKDETNGAGLVATTVIMVTLASAFVGLRFYTRIKIVRALGASDWTILLALLFSIGSTACTLYEIRLGTIARHIWTIRYPHPSIEGLQAVYAGNLLYPLSLLTVKFSILILYLRILSSMFLHRLCYAAIGLVTVLCGFTIINTITACVPVESSWNYFAHPNPWCWPQPATMWANIGIHMFTEVMILVLPMPFLLSLDAPWRRKIGVVLLFALGAIVIIVGAMRLPYIVSLGSSKDATWDSVIVSIWSAIELNTAIICACAMTLKPLMNRICPRLFTDGYHPQGSKEDVTSGGNGAGDRPLTIGTRRNRPVAPDIMALETLRSSDRPDMPT